MKLRKVLAVLLGVAMVASLIVVPTSATVMDTATLDELIPTDTTAAHYESTFTVDTNAEFATGIVTGSATVRVNSTYGVDSVLFGSSTDSTNDSSIYWEEALPAGGAAHLRFLNITAYDTAGFDIATSEGKRIRLIFNIDGGTIRTYVGETATILHSSSTNAISGFTLGSPFEIIIKDTGSALDYYLRQGDTGNFTKIGENVGYPSASSTNTGAWTTAAGYGPRGNIDYIKLYEPKDVVVETPDEPEVPAEGPALPSGIVLEGDDANYKLVFEKDTDEQFAEETTENTGTTISDGLARVSNGSLAWDASLPYQGVAHIRVSNATSYANGGLDVKSSAGKRIRFVFHNTNKKATINYEGSSRDISLEGIDLSTPFDIIIQDTGSGLNYWFGQTGGDTYTVSDSSVYANATTTATSIWTGDSTNKMTVDFIRLYEPDFGTPIEDIISAKDFKLLETSGALSTEANSTQYDLPLNGAVHYKFDGFDSTGIIELSNTARNGGLYMAFNQSNTQQFQINHYSGGENITTELVTSKSVLDASKAFELIVVTTETEAEYFVKPYGKSKFTSLGTYGLAYNTNRTTTNTADVTSMTIYKHSEAPIVIAEYGSAKVITNGATSSGNVRVIFNDDMRAKGKTVIFVGLTSEGAVKAGDIQTRILQDNEEVFNLTEFDSSTIKAFFWDGPSTMTPVDGFAPVTFKK